MAVQMTDQELNRLREAVGVLMGWRPLKGNKPGMAVTRGELETLQTAVSRIQSVLAGTLADMTSTDVTDAPTADDFNALRADVVALHSLLAGIISSKGS